MLKVRNRILERFILISSFKEVNRKFPLIIILKYTLNVTIFIFKSVTILCVLFSVLHSEGSYLTSNG
jgi:hypothetical protein